MAGNTLRLRRWNSIETMTNRENVENDLHKYVYIFVVILAMADALSPSLSLSLCAHEIIVYCMSSAHILSKINTTFRLKRFACLVFRQFWVFIYRGRRVHWHCQSPDAKNSPHRTLPKSTRVSFEHSANAFEIYASDGKQHTILFPLLIVAPISYYFISHFATPSSSSSPALGWKTIAFSV